MSLREALLAWVEHQFVVLQRRSQHRLDKIADRLDLVGGYIIAFLNLDRVIAIIRTEDEPKPVMIAEFDLTHPPAEEIGRASCRESAFPYVEISVVAVSFKK